MAITAAGTIIAVDFTKTAREEVVETLVGEVVVEGVAAEETLEEIGMGATKVTKETGTKEMMGEIEGVDITIEMTIVEVITIVGAITTIDNKAINSGPMVTGNKLHTARIRTKLIFVFPLAEERSSLCNLDNKFFVRRFS